MAEDDITAKRVLRMEERLDQLEERLTAPAQTLALDAIAALRADMVRMFGGVEARLERLEAIDRKLDALLAGLKPS